MVLPEELSVFVVYMCHYVHTGSYMSTHVLLNLLNELEKTIRFETLPSILSVFSNEFNKFT